MKVHSFRHRAGRQFRRHSTVSLRTIARSFAAFALLLPLIILLPATADAQSTCRGKAVTINMNTNGGNGNGTAGNDVILGTSGSETIRGYGGVDTICAGGGNDTIYGDGGSDRIRGEGGHDKIYAGSGADDVWGGPGNDTIYGHGGQDDIWGEDGDDYIQGNHQSDKLYGGNGNDTVAGAGGLDLVYGDAGNDILRGGNNSDQLFGGPGIDSLNGQSGSDTLIGGPGNDTCVNGRPVDCAEVQERPQWFPGSELQLESLSRYDLSVSWCCISAVQPTVRFELSVSDSAGNSDVKYVGPQDFPEITVSSFQGYALDPDESYVVEIVAVNNAGRSAPLRLGPISVVKTESSITVNGNNIGLANAFAAGFGSGTTTVDGTFTLPGGGDCPHNPHDIRSNIKQTLFGVTMFHHEATSRVCHDGNDFYWNDITQHTCEKFRNSDTGIETTRDQPETASIINTFYCVWDADVTAALKAALKFGAISPSLDIGTSFNSDGGHTFEHIVQIDGSGITLTMSRWDGAEPPS